MMSVPQTQNLVINGNFDFWQRGTSFAAIAANTYTADRWELLYTSSTGVFTVSRQTDAPTAAQSGYQGTYCYQLAVTTADTSIAAGEFVLHQQAVEGYNYATIAGQPFSLGFWCKHHRTGIYCVSFLNSGQDRSYVAEYTQNVADTWEYKNIYVSTGSPLAGTWDYTNGIGLRVFFAQAIGSTFQTTAGSWQTGQFYSTSNQVNGIGATSDVFKIDQVTLGYGSISPIFSLAGKTIDRELVACQRYYWRPNFDSTNANVTLAMGQATTTTNAYLFYQTPVSMRTTPTLISGGTLALFTSIGGLVNTTALAINIAGPQYGTITTSTAGSLTAGAATILTRNADATAYFALSAEL